jgi:hypothetical protein
LKNGVRNKAKIGMSECWTCNLTPKAVLQAKLHKALLEAKARLEFQREGDGDE